MNTAEVGLIDSALKADADLVIAALEALKLPYKTWGTTPGSGTFREFMDTWKLGQIDWDPENPTNELRIDSVAVTILWDIIGRSYRLQEKYRESESGTTIEAPDQQPFSMARMIAVDETPHEATIRCMTDHLRQSKFGFDDSRRFDLRPNGVKILESQPSVRFPGFKEIVNQKQFICIIDEHLYEEEYVLKKGDWTIYYHWVEIDSLE